MKPYAESRPWVVEFSQSQRAFSVRSIDEAIFKNLHLFVEAMPCDHSIVALATSRDQAIEISKILDDRVDRSTPFTPNQVLSLVARIRELFSGDDLGGIAWTRSPAA